MNKNQSMKRKLSSPRTFGLKIIFPLFFTIYCGMGLYAIYFSPIGHSLPLSSAILLSVILLIIPPAIIWIVRKFKVVSVDDNFLYVSNYLKEISIPLADIDDVTEKWSFKGAPVTIHLKTDTAFGRKIVFTPQQKGLNPFAAQTIVRELKELAKINL